MKKIRVRWIIQAVCLVLVWLLKLFPHGGEWYATTIYPVCSGGLACFSSFFPFSLNDLFIYGSLAGILLYLLYALLWKHRVKQALVHVVEYLVWVYIWFYAVWGLNYYRNDFYQRTQLQRQVYSEELFERFLQVYTDSLNAAYCLVDTVEKEKVEAAIKASYAVLDKKYGLTCPPEILRPKPMLFPSLMSGVGVMGYIGPFFIESHLSKDLLPVQYAATCAHEMAHVLGISSEAEANYYSYLICTTSSEREIRFSGYFSLLPYVLSNVYRVLPEADFKAWRETLRPEVVSLYREKADHWQALYNPLLGEIQDKMYNWYLKGNRISSGTANYSEVIGLIIAAQSASF